MNSRRLPLALLWILLDFVNALQVNVIVDDANPLITYTGNNWTSVDNCGECWPRLNVSRLEGGSYHMAHQGDCNAEFRFTGISISVYGVTSHHWGETSPNVSFTIDGTERFMEITNTNGGSNPQYQYNQTLFQVDNLPNAPHTLSIQTHDNSLFVFDYLTYGTDASVVTAASNGTYSTESGPASPSTSPFDQSAPSSSIGTQPAVVGAVAGGTVGAILIAGIIALWCIRRAKQRRRGSSEGTLIDRKYIPLGRRRGGHIKVDSGSSFGGITDQSTLGETRDGAGRREEKQRVGIPGEYAISGSISTHAPVLLATRELEALSEAASNGGGRYLSAISTFTSSSRGGEDGKEHVVHALTTNSPQQADPMPLGDASRWPSAKRSNTADAAAPVYGSPQWQNTNTAGVARPFRHESTLEVDGVLERVMLSHSNVPGRSSREEERPRVFFSDHPFRSMGSG